MQQFVNHRSALYSGTGNVRSGSKYARQHGVLIESNAFWKSTNLGNEWGRKDTNTGVGESRNITL